MNTSNGDLQQKILSNRTLLIITTRIDHRIGDRTETCSGTPHTLAVPMMKEVITDVARSSARVIRTHRQVSCTVRDGTTPGKIPHALRFPLGYLASSDWRYWCVPNQWEQWELIGFQ